MLKFAAFVTLLLTTTISWAKPIEQSQSNIIDQTNSLSLESVSKINKAISQVKEKHNVKIQFYLLHSLNGDSEESVAKDLFNKHKLNTGDILFLVSQTEKRSRFWVGQDLQKYFTRVEVRHTLDDILPPYFQNKDYEGAFLKVVSNVSTSLGNAQFRYIFEQVGESPVSESSTSLFVWLLFIVLILGVIITTSMYMTNKNRLAKKYPMFEYEKAKEFEKMQDTKRRFLTILKKEYPGQNVYQVYRKLARDYKKNKANGTKVNDRGVDNNFDLAYFSFIPFYILMFNSPYTPLNFTGHRVSNDGSSSSGCGTSSSCGGGDSGGGGCGGGGCGGGGCGG